MNQTTIIQQLKKLQTPIFLILVGPPGSGKSTLIKALNASGLNFFMHGNDQVLEEEMVQKKYSYAEAHKLTSQSFIKKVIRERVAQSVLNNENTGIDQTHMSKKTRVHHLRFAGANYCKVAIVFDTSTKNLIQRCVEREHATGKYIPNFVIHSMVNSYQPVSKDEGFDHIFQLEN